MLLYFQNSGLKIYLYLVCEFLVEQRVQDYIEIETWTMFYGSMM